jgi:hypothetical protein
MTRTALNPIPLRPDLSGRPSPSDHFIRAVSATLLSEVHRGSAAGVAPETFAAERWPNDDMTLRIVKAATGPATTTTSGWASQLAANSVADFVLNMGPASVGSALLRRGLSLSFDGAGSITVPGVLAAAGHIGFVAEGAPIGVHQLSVSGPTLAPHKFAVIMTFTRETFAHSTPTIEALVRAALGESVSLALDTALLDATASDATRPAGLRNGVAGLTATAGGGNEALLADLKALAVAVAPVAGNAPIVFIANPAQAVAIRMRLAGELGYDVLSSSGLAAGTVVAIASNALVSAIDPVPRFTVGMHGTMHMEDVAPAAIGTAGTPNVVSAPVRSLFQTDSIGLRLILDVSWSLRTSGALAWVSGVTW